MNFIQELLQRLETKNSWGKNEVKMLVLELMAKYFGTLK